MLKKEHKWLLAIFIITLSIRLILAFTVPNFTYDSYFHLRQVEHITEQGWPLYQDDLSYGGREMLFLPFFHYLMAAFNLLLPLELVAKIIPNLLLASLTVIIYLIGKHISAQNSPAPLFSAFIAGFLPILFSTNAFTVEALFLPLLFVTIYAFLNIDKKKSIYLYIGSFLILSLTSPATALLILGFGIYLLLSFIEKKRTNRAEIELILFSVFFFVWTQFLFFKDTFLEKGVTFLWQNIPSTLILQYLPKLSISESIVLVSIVPFLTGIYVVYRSLFQLKNKKIFLLISFAVSTTLFTWFRIIPFRLSLAFFGLILAILFASFYNEVIAFSKKTKFSKSKNFISLGLLGLLIITMCYPAINTALQQETPQEEEIRTFLWISNNAPENAGVLALLEEGHLVTYYSKRKNLIDDQFGNIKDVEKKFKDYTSLFQSPFQTQAISILDEYKIDYLVLTTRAQEKYKMKRFKFQVNECFEKVYSTENENEINGEDNAKLNITGSSKVYKKKCTLTKTQ